MVDFLRKVNSLSFQLLPLVQCCLQNYITIKYSVKREILKFLIMYVTNVTFLNQKFLQSL